MRVLLPALLTFMAGLAAHAAWGSALLTIASAAIAAMAGSLVLYDFDTRPKPEDEDETDPVIPAKPDAPSLGAAQIIGGLPHAALIIDQDQQIKLANQHAAELFGIASLAGLPVSTLRARRLLDRIDMVLKQRAASTLDFTLTRAGDAQLRAHIQPLGLDGRLGVSVLIEDQTRAQRAAELHRDFVANASHELKTPLAAVSGIIETLLGPARSDPAATERFLHLLQTQTDRMTRLIEDLLSLNRIELNERVVPDDPQDLLGVVAEVVDVLTPIAEVGEVRLVFDPPESTVIVLADRDELGQLFRNLIDNAIKYGGRGTEVTIKTLMGHPEHENMIGISVRDQGPGIPREDLPRLTERFYRVNIKRSRDKGGTGLGLAICKHILNRHRGRLEIDSREGKGARFTAWLPIHQVDDAKTTPVSESVPLA